MTTTTQRVKDFLRSADLLGMRLYTCARQAGFAGAGIMRDRLEKEGATYRQLVALERQRRARELLSRNRHACNFRIAQICGTHPHHISRSFKQWFGMTISEYKKQMRATQ